MPPPCPGSEDFPTVLKNIHSAVDMLVQLRIAPTPERVTVAYAHFTEEMNELSQALTRLVSRDKLTSQAVDELYQQYFGHSVSSTDLKDANLRFERTVAEVSDCIGAARGKAEHFGYVLAEFLTGLKNADATLVKRVGAVLEETLDLADVNHRLTERLVASSREIVMLREHLERLEREASFDGLTGIPNRKAFDDHLRRAVANAMRTGQPLSLLMIDIDLFKQFNDSHGHILGDQVLKLVARTMSECIKGDDLPARYGGEEFCVILPGAALEAAAAVADSIRVLVASKKVVNRRTGITLGTITLSIGVAMLRPGEPSSYLVGRADEALYQAKQTGRNRVVTETALPS